jgi:cellulose synthase/poly-beta-1,6-N-acetylglucosamine synthase-like glycosyltransferase
MFLITFLWAFFLIIFMGSYLTYFTLLKIYAKKPWQLKLDRNFSPPLSILVPAYNEEKVIQKKLENLAEVSYPKEKLEIIVIDDCSTDRTLDKIKDFAKKYPELNIKVLKMPQRVGKANALNEGLKLSSNEIIVMTDADSLWPPDILRKALPYVSNPKIGAITGGGVAPTSIRSWVLDAEKRYLGLMSLLRLGESKIHSTIRFEGCFCIFKKSVFEKFDNESGADDSGTALNIVQNNFRTIFVQEIYAFSEFPTNLKSKIQVKVRRAFHLTGLWLRCLKLLLKGQLKLPKKIAIPELFLMIFNPIIFVALVIVTFIMIMFNPNVLIPFVIILFVVALAPKARNYLVEGILDQFILFYAILLQISRKKIVAWEKYT